MNSRLKRILYTASTLSLSLVTTTPAYPCSKIEPRKLLDSLLGELDNSYPEVVAFIETLDEDSVRAICQNDKTIIEQSSDLQLLIALVSKVQEASSSLCVVKELQSMIGNREILEDDTPKKDPK